MKKKMRMMIVLILIYIYIPRTQITHVLEDLTRKMEGQPPTKRSNGF